MAWPVGAAPLGTLRAGRLLEAPIGLIDLATGCPARLESQVVPLASAAAWQPSALGSSGADAADWCVDSWLTQDWLGRWVARSVRVRHRPATLDAGAR